MDERKLKMLRDISRIHMDRCSFTLNDAKHSFNVLAYLKAKVINAKSFTELDATNLLIEHYSKDATWSPADLIPMED
jgi:hypothetical protein